LHCRFGSLNRFLSTGHGHHQAESCPGVRSRLARRFTPATSSATGAISASLSRTPTKALAETQFLRRDRSPAADGDRMWSSAGGDLCKYTAAVVAAVNVPLNSEKDNKCESYRLQCCWPAVFQRSR
jgi:hypothetical protein